jgi:hypothetical protein
MLKESTLNTAFDEPKSFLKSEKQPFRGLTSFLITTFGKWLKDNQKTT